MHTSQKEKEKSKSLIHRLSSVFSWKLGKKLLILTFFSLVINHLSERDNFPDSDAYSFSFEGIVAYMILGTIIGIIEHFNLSYYKKTYFKKQVEAVTITKFVLSTLGYIVLIYIPIYLILIYINNGEPQFYYFLVGLLLTLLLSFIALFILYANDIYDLYKISLKEAKITIAHGAKTAKLTYETIACFYSENKIVYSVQHNGKTMATDFTLNELETMINDQLFFRANRQVILHINSIDHIEKIENGKLVVTLKSSIPNSEVSQINISRYKRKAFLDWFKKSA